MRTTLTSAAIVCAVLLACRAEQKTAAQQPETATAREPNSGTVATTEQTGMRISSAAFSEQGSIPQKYTCDEGETIPPLAFSGVPPTAKSLALVVDDPDAPSGTWDHWVVWNIPPGATGNAEGKPPEGTVGKNGWGKNAWGGPCPPAGEHRYVFKLYALDAMLDLPASSGRHELENAMSGKIIAQTQLVGRYARRR